jgi:predicted anti-sigma-YlaC factor YlaD
MKPCPDFEPLLLDRAAGDLGAADVARLADHLTGCAACRAEGEALAAALSLAALPPVAESERAALTGLAESVRLEQRRAELGTRRPLRYAAALLAVAAAVAFLVAPAFTRRGPNPPGAELPAGLVAAAGGAAEAAEWEPPDTDEVWSEVDLASDDGAAAAMSGADELALDVLLADD